MTLISFPLFLLSFPPLRQAAYQLGQVFALDFYVTGPLAVSCSIMAMLTTKTMHPPGGGTALLAVIGGANIHNLGWMFAVAPCGTGACVLVATGVVFHNLLGTSKYPVKWW